MKITLIEPEYHIEVLVHYVEVLHDLGHVLYVMAKPAMVKELTEWFSDKNNISYFASEDKMDLLCVRQKNIIEASDLVIVTTYFKNIRIVKILSESTKLLLVLHNVRSILDYKYFLSGNMRAVKYMGSHALEIFKDKKRVDYFTTAAQSVHDYARLRYPDIAPKIVGPLNFTYIHRNRSAQSQNAMKRIIVPGSIRASHRDYKVIYEAVTRWYPSLNAKVKMIFLGPAVGNYAQRIKKLFGGLNDDYFDFFFFEEAIPLGEYYDILQTADLAILPLTKSVEHLGGKELQGRTTWAGTLNDVIRYQIPSCIYGDYPLDLKDDLPFKRFADAKTLAEDLIAWQDDKLVFYEPELSLSSFERNRLYKRFGDVINKKALKIVQHNG